MVKESKDYADALMRMADWAVFHGFKHMVQGALRTIDEMGLEISPEITARAAFRAVTDSLDALTYASDPELFDNVIGLISAMVVYGDLADADKYEWYSMLRELVRQGAMALLAKQFLTNPAIAPGSPDDITIARTFKAEDFQAKMETYFDAHGEIYEDQEDDLDTDKSTFGGTKAKRSVNKKQLFALLSAHHSLGSLKTKYGSYLRKLECATLGEYCSVLPTPLLKTVIPTVAIEPEWSTSKAAQSGPYSAASASSHAQQHQEAFAPAPDLEQEDIPAPFPKAPAVRPKKSTAAARNPTVTTIEPSDDGKAVRAQRSTANRIDRYTPPVDLHAKHKQRGDDAGQQIEESEKHDVSTKLVADSAEVRSRIIPGFSKVPYRHFSNAVSTISDTDEDDEDSMVIPFHPSSSSAVQPGRLAKTIKQLDRKYDAQDPLKEALGSHDQRTSGVTSNNADQRSNDVKEQRAHRSTASQIDRYAPAAPAGQSKRNLKQTSESKSNDNRAEKRAKLDRTDTSQKILDRESPTLLSKQLATVSAAVEHELYFYPSQSEHSQASSSSSPSSVPPISTATVRPGQLSSTINKMDRKYAALDPLQSALGGTQSISTTEPAAKTVSSAAHAKAKPPAKQVEVTRISSKPQRSGANKIDKYVPEDTRQRNLARQQQAEQESSQITPKSGAAAFSSRSSGDKKRKISELEEEENSEEENVGLFEIWNRHRSPGAAVSTLRQDTVDSDIGPAKKHRYWTQEEDEALMKGVATYGKRWAAMMKDAQIGAVLKDRNAEKCKDRYRVIESKKPKLQLNLETK